jgi:UDP-glucose 4-epimerase
MIEKQKTILVTGGAGFIGSHLCERLAKNPDNRVISLDNYFTGTKENHMPGVEYREGHTKDIEKLIPETPDIIYHLGEYARTEASFDDVPLVFEMNTVGTLAVLEFCRKKKPKLIYAGSSTKFADGGLGRDQSPYAWTKAANTELVRNYSEWFGFPYAITYFYNVYGPGERAGSHGTLIEIFRQKYLADVSLTVRLPGTQRRNFTHVDDIVQGLLLVGEKGSGDEYGLGNEDSYSVLEIAEMFGAPVETLEERKGNRTSGKIDTSRMKNEFGWKAEKSVKDYIRNIITEKKNDPEHA